MRITYDARKRAETLEHRGIDFEDAARVFGGKVFQMEDDRQDYGENRVITVGLLAWSSWSGPRAMAAGASSQ
jgi:uncharacterized protein